MERNKTKEEAIAKADEAMRQYELLLRQQSVEITNINPDDPDDQRLIFDVFLRNQTREDLFKIASGLAAKMNDESDPEHKGFLLDLGAKVARSALKRKTE